MDEMREGDERPTMNLMFIDGILHQKWEVTYWYETAEDNGYVATKEEWRKVPSRTNATTTGEVA